MLRIYVLAMLAMLVYGQILLLQEFRAAQFAPNPVQMCLKPLARLGGK